MDRRFLVVTDHKPLANLNLKSRPDEKLGDIANFLLLYDFNIVYHPGSANAEADLLSRNPVLEADTSFPTSYEHHLNFLSSS